MKVHKKKREREDSFEAVRSVGRHAIALLPLKAWRSQVWKLNELGS